MNLRITDIRNAFRNRPVDASSGPAYPVDCDVAEEKNGRNGGTIVVSPPAGRRFPLVEGATSPDFVVRDHEIAICYLTPDERQDALQTLIDAASRIRLESCPAGCSCGCSPLDDHRKIEDGMRRAIRNAVYESEAFCAYREANRKIHEAARAFRQAQRELEAAVAGWPYLTAEERKTIERVIDHTDSTRWENVDQHAVRDVTAAAVDRAVETTLDPTREQTAPARLTIDLWNGRRSFGVEPAAALAETRTDFPIASRRTG